MQILRPDSRNCFPSTSFSVSSTGTTNQYQEPDKSVILRLRDKGRGDLLWRAKKDHDAERKAVRGGPASPKQCSTADAGIMGPEYRAADTRGPDQITGESEVISTRINCSSRDLIRRKCPNGLGSIAAFHPKAEVRRANISTPRIAAYGRGCVKTIWIFSRVGKH